METHSKRRLCNCLGQVMLRSQDKSNGGPTQRASALAALNSAFKSSPTAKSSSVTPRGPSQGSQRAAAVAALSSVLTAEKKGSRDASPVRHNKSPPTEAVSPVIGKSEEVSDVFENNEGSEVNNETSEVSQNEDDSTTDDTANITVNSGTTLTTSSGLNLKTM